MTINNDFGKQQKNNENSAFEKEKDIFDIQEPENQISRGGRPCKTVVLGGARRKNCKPDHTV
jgi:hypothetical protein